MSHRREIARRLESLSDIAGIMSAMKGLALMEIHHLTDFLACQRRMVAGIEDVAADFLLSHSRFRNAEPVQEELCVLVGSEQGFCGDFNDSLLLTLNGLWQEQTPPFRRIIVGQRLASRIGEQTRAGLIVPGALVADEVPGVLLHLTQALIHALASKDLTGYGLSVLYHCSIAGDIRLRRLLPLPDLPMPHPVPAYPAELDLSPADFFDGLTTHYLHAVLNEVLYSSLMAENQQRQAHMDRALQRLDHDTARLRLKYNIQRQEEITEEIELILLSADMLNETAGPEPL